MQTRSGAFRRYLFRVRHCLGENHVKDVLRRVAAALEWPEYGVTASHGLARQSTNTIGTGKARAPDLVHITTECRIAPRNQYRAGRLPFDAPDGRSIGHGGPHRGTVEQAVIVGFRHWIDFRCSTAVQVADDLNPWIVSVHVDSLKAVVLHLCSGRGFAIWVAVREDDGAIRPTTAPASSRIAWPLPRASRMGRAQTFG